MDKIENGHRAEAAAYLSGTSGRTFWDFLLFGVTAVELALLVYLTPTFEIADWIYVSQHLLVFAIAATRAPPKERDYSLPTGLAVVVSYAYTYAQVIYLRWVPGDVAWPMVGLVMVTLSAFLSCASLLTLGRWFGVRPALRGLMTKGPYRIVRHPMYLAYIIGDVGYNLEEWNIGTALMVLIGWAALFYRIQAEERVISKDARWASYAALVPYRLIPGLW